MSNNHDQQYIDRVLSGDTHAFEVLIERYKHMVYTLAFKMVGIKEDAEEVAQDVFLKAFTALNTYKGEAKFSTWLYKIAYYRSLDYLKKNKRKVRTSTIDISEEYDVAALEGTLDALESTERTQMIREAMETLAPDDSVIITLYYFEELSLKEIAKVMDLTPNNVKVRLFRSRSRLAEVLSNTAEPEMIRQYGSK
ncbi:RNA polymerase sigma factor [Muriicola sp. Z0-33]|uniref:RNA polymerase sigma factor n=1 Tax=Muriicola sp. Z0-33 TaxID=2816957 RepID=UPI002237AE90|nr:sigma-70 family RNA polymerase sigma factor [Muriicola sp. Z0-33]MCW5517393.1 sigma-70 family RNA polymerase sigma factor [Muriicola sp. Z0-33]